MRRIMTIIALGLAAALAAPPARAQSWTPRPDRGHAHHTGAAAPQQTFIQGSTAPCTCRAQGRDFLEGESICLNGSVAYCDMEQNVTTWRLTRQACPQS